MSNTANSKKRFIMTSRRFLISAGALVAQAEGSYAVRDYGRIKGIGEALILTDSPAFSSIGSYYAGLGTFANACGPLEQAREHFLAALSFAPSHYRQRALLSLANLFYHEREYSRWRNLCESIAKLDDPVAVIEARRDLAIYEALDGGHKKALALLEDLYPMAAASPLYIRHRYFNSLAVELLATGKVGQARQASAEAIASPFAPFNPEWQATARDIAAVTPAGNLIAMPPVRDERASAFGELIGTLRRNRPRYSLERIRELTAEAGR